LVFVAGVALKYETIYFKNYELAVPQWAGLLFAGITFSFVVLDQLLRGFVRLEEVQRRDEERNCRDKATERETRRTGIENRYRIAVIRFILDPSQLHRRQLADILALLEEYWDTL
jgi:hypothetical protein